MFWRERERDAAEQSGGSPCGQVRVLVVGDSGVGKTSLVHLIVKGFTIANPPRTVGCTVSVKLITCGSPGGSSNSINGDAERGFFVELWDVSGHERYKDCRSLFYTQINGVIFVHDLSQRRTKTSLQKWAAEIASVGTFSAPLGSGGPCGLPVPHLVIGNKIDIASKEGARGSSGNLVDAARLWVEKQGLLPSSEALPLTESFPSSGDLLAAAKGARYDKESIIKFFRMLIRRRYFSDEPPALNPWSMTPSLNSVPCPDLISSDDQSIRIASLNDETYKYGTLPPFPAQRNRTTLPTLHSQQPVMIPETYYFQRLSVTGSPESCGAETKRADVIV